jgi:hypothetical protein
MTPEKAVSSVSAGVLQDTFLLFRTAYPIPGFYAFLIASFPFRLIKNITFVP